MSRHLARTLLGAWLLGLAPGIVAAQLEPTRPVPRAVHYGKWLALGGAVALGLLAQHEHDLAEQADGALRAYCFDDFSRCDLGPDGRYQDPVSEGYYQTTLTHDHRAGRWLVGGEALLLGAAAGFIWELTRHAGLPPNIPLAPAVSATPGTTRVGLRLSF
jgi:hypothetical protein